jgi:hypothetical protein
VSAYQDCIECQSSLEHIHKDQRLGYILHVHKKFRYSADELKQRTVNKKPFCNPKSVTRVPKQSLITLLAVDSIPFVIANALRWRNYSITTAASRTVIWT